MIGEALWSRVKLVVVLAVLSAMLLVTVVPPAHAYGIDCSMTTMSCFEVTDSGWTLYGFDDQGNWWVKQSSSF